MIIHLSGTELEHLSFQPVERGERSSAYLAERELAWAAQMEKVLARNDKMWNGEVYTLEEILTPAEGQVRFIVSTAEYKDAVFKWEKGLTYIEETYGIPYLFRFMTVDCVPVTRDGKFIFGIRGDGGGGGLHPISPIGGGLNKDEMEVHDFADVRRFMLKELEEETALACAPEAFQFYALGYEDAVFTFMFTLPLPIHSHQIQQYHRDGEFSRLIALTAQEADAISLPTARAFRQWRSQLCHLSSPGE